MVMKGRRISFWTMLFVYAVVQPALAFDLKSIGEAIKNQDKQGAVAEYVGFEVRLSGSNVDTSILSEALEKRLQTAAIFPLTSPKPTEEGRYIFEFRKPIGRKAALEIIKRVRSVPDVLWATLIPVPKLQVAMASPIQSGKDAAGGAQQIREIIVKLRSPETHADAAKNKPLAESWIEYLSKAAAVELTHVRPMSGGAYVLRLPYPMSALEVDLVLGRLRNDPAIKYADPVIIMLPQRVPNDSSYNQQWYLYESLGGIKAPNAWDVTIGGHEIVVAVIDTGVLPHPDLAGRILPGYDMISSPFQANDGNGRDADASDPGDWTAAGECRIGSSANNSSWHGTHVAGIVGAATNNAIGIAGVNWQSKILPVRVLGKCGGNLDDIADGIRWAAGISVPGVTRNPYPARVINLSLGGLGICSSSFQEAIDDALATGAVVVVAAANQSQDAQNYTPANCKGVITVAAVGRYGNLASYSNHGATVEIAAPGGDYALDPGILSTVSAGTTVPTIYTYKGLQGTSMAAPVVSGVASLMMSVNPALTPSQVLALMQGSARHFGSLTLCGLIPAYCGAGIVSAYDAVLAARNATLTPAQGYFSTLGYLPLNGGNSWSYRGSDLSMVTRTVSQGVDELNGYGVKQIHGSDGSIWYFTNDGDGIREYGEVEGTDALYFNPPLQYAKAVTYLGERVNSTGTATYEDLITGMQYPLTFSLSSTPEVIEQISVPSGTYDALRVKVTGYATDWWLIYVPLASTYWLAKDVGVVKQTTSDGTYQLVSTNVTIPPDPIQFLTLQSPWFSTAPGYISRFVFTNTSSSPAPFTISILTEAGNLPIPTGISGTIPANGQYVVNASDIVAGFTGVTRGAAIFTINGSTSHIQGLYQIVYAATGSISNTVMLRPGSETATTTLQTPWFSTAPGYISRFVLTNKGNTNAPYTISLVTEANNLAVPGISSGSIPANRQAVVSASDIVLGFSNATRASAIFTISASDANIEGIYQIVYPNTGSVSNTVLGRPSSSTGRPTVMQAPWFSTAPSYISRFVFKNKSSTVMPYTVDFLTETGNIVLPIATTGSIPANSQYVIPATDLVAGFSGNTRGAAIFTVDGADTDIDALYQIVNPDTGSISNTPLVKPGRVTSDATFQSPWFSTAPPYISRFVLTNAGLSAAPYTINLITESGNTATPGVTSGTIPAHSQMVINATDIVTGFTSATRAAAVFTINGSEAMIQGLYQIVNPATGSVSNTLMVKPAGQ